MAEPWAGLLVRDRNPEAVFDISVRNVDVVPLRFDLPIEKPLMEIIVNDIAFVFQFGLTIVPAVAVGLFIRRLSDAEGASLADAFRIALDPPWPHGVQEEEPQPWRVELIARSRLLRLGPALRCDRQAKRAAGRY
jgi:hypothetical protein